MQKRPNSNFRLVYRHYNLPVDFPIIAFLGDNWVLLDEIQFLHFHNCLEIGYCHSGEGMLRVENKEFAFEPGNVSVISQNALHNSRSNKGSVSKWEYICVDSKHLFESFFSEIPNARLLLYDSPDFKNIIDNNKNPTIQSIVLAILREFHEKSSEYEIRGLYLSLMIELTRTISQYNNKNMIHEPPRLIILPSIIYINSNYNKNIKIQELSDLCHLSATHFRRLFKSVMNTSPLDYINHIRIRKSCNFLYSSNKCILEISCIVGFSSVSSFNRHFLLILGISPSEWRKTNAYKHKTNEIASAEAEYNFDFFNY